MQLYAGNLTTGGPNPSALPDTERHIRHAGFPATRQIGTHHAWLRGAGCRAELYADNPSDSSLLDSKAHGSPLSALSVIVITGCLLHRAMLGLLHRLRQGNTALRRLRQIAGSQAVGGKLLRLQSGQRAAPLDDQVDRLRSERPLLHRFPTVDGAEDRPLADVGPLEPTAQRLDRRPDQKHPPRLIP